MSFGWQERRETISRLFFMLRPDEAANASVDRALPHWREEFGLRGKPVAAGRRHVSLAGVGRKDHLPAGFIELVRGLAARVEAAPFEVVFDRIANFTGGSIVLFAGHGNPGVDGFSRAFSRAMEETPLAGTRRFVPHMTVLHDHSAGLPAQPIEPISWMARQFLLIESVQGEGRHIEWGRWDLRADGRSAPPPDIAAPPLLSQPALWRAAG